MPRARSGVLRTGVVALLVLAACGSDGSDGPGAVDPTDPPSPAATQPPAVEVQEHPEFALVDGELVAVPEPPEPSDGGVLTELDEGRFLLTRSWAAPVGTVGSPAQIFEPDMGRWTVLPPDPFGGLVSSTSYVAVADGFLLVGQACVRSLPNETADSAVDFCDPGELVAARYDLPAQRWHPLEVPATVTGGVDTPLGAAEVLAAEPSTGEVLLTLQGQTWRYTRAGDRWTKVDEPPYPYAEIAGPCATPEGFVIVAIPATQGGNGPEASQDPVATVLRADGSWAEYPNELPGRPTQPASRGKDGFCTDRAAVVFGSDDQQQSNAWAYRFDPAAGTWAEVGTQPEVLWSVGAWPVDGGAIVVSPGASATYRFDDAAGTWAETPVTVGLGMTAISRAGIYVGRPDPSTGTEIGRLLAARLS